MLSNRLLVLGLLLAAGFLQPLFAAGLSDEPWFIFIGRLHVVILHLPIGILGLAILTGLLRLLRLPLFDDRGQLVLLLLGSFSALLAVVLGIMFAQEESMSELKYWHMYTGIAVFASSLTALLFFGRNVKAKSAVNSAGYAVSLLLCGITLIWSGHLGGSVTRGEHWLTKYAPWQAKKKKSSDVTVPSSTDEGEQAAVNEQQAIAANEHVAKQGNGGDSGNTAADQSMDGSMNNSMDDPMDNSMDMSMSSSNAGAMAAADEKAALANAALFKESVEPILAARCYECHGASKRKADLRLDTADFIRAGGKGGAVIVPGQPERSSLYTLVVLDEDDPDIMPSKGKPLSKQQTDVIHKWILGGALFGDDGGKPAAAIKSTQEDKRVSLVEQQSQGLAKPDESSIKRLEKAGVTVEALSSNGALLEVDLRFMAQPFDKLRYDLLKLKDHIVWFDASRTAADDNVLKELTKLPRLQRLMLNNSKVTDQGMQHIASIRSLEVLNLYACNVSDKGLKHLHKLSSLRKIYLWQTKVTKAGVQQLQKALPKLEISSGK